MTDESYSTLKSMDALSPRGLAGKREYVIELERRGGDAALRQLVECLNDESGYLRDLAGAALARLGAPAAPLVPLLASGLWYTRVSALRTLARLGDASCAPAIAPLLADSNQSVRAEAAGALIALASSADEVRVARALFATPEPARARALRELVAQAPAVGRRIEALLRDKDLMLAAEDELLPRSPDVRATAEDGVAWDVLTGVAPFEAPGFTTRPR